MLIIFEREEHCFEGGKAWLIPPKDFVMLSLHANFDKASARVFRTNLIKLFLICDTLTLLLFPFLRFLPPAMRQIAEEAIS